ncbi:MAG: cupredoxin domain-containing protein [Patescibacteria group bacterium]
MNNKTLSENKKGILLFIIILVVLGLIFWLASYNYKKKTPQTKLEEGQGRLEMSVPIPETEKPKLKKSPLGEFNPEKPEKTTPLAPEKVEELSEKSGVIKMTISPTGFKPKEFTVKAGQTVSLILTAIGSSHRLVFEDPVLSNVSLGITLGEARGISFVAPTKKGDYVFYCSESEHRQRGEQGVMHVR